MRPCRVAAQRCLVPPKAGFGWTPAPAFGNNLLMNIGKRLRELRQAKNLSQGDLERLAGFHRSCTSRVEMGHGVPSLQTLDRYAAALDVEMSQLFSGGGMGPPGSKHKGMVSYEREIEGDKRSLLVVFNDNLQDQVATLKLPARYKKATDL